MLRAEPQRPPTNPLNAEARRRRDAENPREFSAWRGSGRRTTARDRWNEPQFRSRAIVTGARSSGLRLESAGLATSHLYLMVGRGTPPFQIGERRGGTDARRVGRWEAWLRWTLASRADGFPTGKRRSSDRRQFRRQSPAPLHHVGKNICVYLRYLRFLRCVGGLCAFVSSCLRRALASLWLHASAFFSLCVPSLCLCASVVQQVGARARKGRWLRC
jgi:hypothetical protein